jgi:hypothetical protein
MFPLAEPASKEVEGEVPQLTIHKRTLREPKKAVGRLMKERRLLKGNFWSRQLQ